MNKRLKLAIIATVAATCCMYADRKLSNSATLMLEAYNTMKIAPLSHDAAEAAARYPGISNETAALVTVNGPEGIEWLRSNGYEVCSTDDGTGIVIATIPLDDIDEITAQESIEYIDFGTVAIPLLDMAREASGVNPVHTGSDEALKSTAYTGKGVIAALFDTGLDPNHANFKDNDSDLRVKYLTTVMTVNSTQRIYSSAAAIRTFPTENSGETHGTHVLGILAGAYKGDVTSAGETISNPYYGVATGADIAIGCGDLYGANILKGVESIINYAEQNNQPAVVNLSIGMTQGQHDEGESFAAKLDALGERAIICVAAGNDGDIPMGAYKKLTADDNTFKTFIQPFSSRTGTFTSASSFNGTAEFYASDSRPFTIKLVTYTRGLNSGTINGEYTVTDNCYVGGSATEYDQLSGFDRATSSSSYIRFNSVTTQGTSRYGMIANFTLNMTTSTTYLGVIIEGQEGQTINAYINATNQNSTGIYGSFSNRSQEGWDDGSANGSINTMACGKNVICIGSYTTRNKWPLLDVRTGASSHTVDDITDFSSYGTIYDGRNLPDICAPGAGIVSSYSSYYSGLSTASMSAHYEGTNYYWGQMQGTSMASPFAAGTVALWLEADPTLTVEDVRDIMKQTAKRDSYVEAGDQVQWGAGKLDALAGIIEVLKRSNAGVSSITADDESALVIRNLGNRQ